MAAVDCQRSCKLAALSEDPSVRALVPGYYAMGRWSAQRAHYALQRAWALTSDLTPRLRACGTSVRHVRCDCHRRSIHARCRQRWVCDECRVDWSRRCSRKLMAALCGHLDAELRREHPPTRWQAERRHGSIVVLITASVRQVGSIASRREQIRDAWTAVRKYIQKTTGRSWPYALVWEFTEGTRSAGNLHVHIAAVWPWVDWKRIVRVWRRAVHDNAAHIRIMKAKGKGKGAAVYLAKYMSKGVQMAEEYAPELYGEFLASQYNQRGLSTSAHFFEPPRKVCRYCDGPIVWVKRPDPLACAMTLARQSDVVAAFRGLTPEREHDQCSS
jgi:hypothetical protein